jgi:Ribosomal proteins 50S-L18Ae/60S-L20/60S-L18A
MYKEYRNVSRTLAVESLYQDMAARHRARFRSIHVLPSLSWCFCTCSSIRQLLILGYSSCRNPEDRGRQASIYPAITH